MTNDRTIGFGVSRSHSGEGLLAGARLFVEALHRRLGQTVRLSVADDYEQLLDMVVQGAVDLAWMPPLLQARANDAFLLAVCERGGALVYRAALLVRTESRYRSVLDLKNARAVWTDPNSASGYVFPRRHLRAAGLEPRQLLSESFAGSASNAMAAVIDHRADFSSCFVTDAAGADRLVALADVQRAFAPAGWRLRVLDVTASIPPDGFLLTPGVDAKHKAQLQNVLLTLHDTPDGATALRELLSATRLVAATEPVSRALEHLRARRP